MKKFFKIAAIVLAILFCLLFGIWVYLYETMTVGDTRGLLDNLKQLEDVTSIDGYRTYEGNAFFTLKLSNGGILTLGNVGNKDLVAQDGIIVEKVGVNEIVCNDSVGIFTVGVTASEIEAQYLKERKLNNVQAIIKNYKQLDELFSSMPLKFNRLITTNEESIWICRSR